MAFLNSDFSSKSFSKSITYGNSILLHLKCSHGFIILYIYIFTGRGESIIYGKENHLYIVLQFMGLDTGGDAHTLMVRFMLQRWTQILLTLVY